jgi:alkanesulfonate monooxygenase SsuD/methylene tetrahydromethanopterin reductase-like flavin-dependent oxidoreductase (luciferase family)
LAWTAISGLIEARAGDKDDAMRVGISLTSNYPDAKDPRQGARWMIERAAAAHRAGLASLFVGDQHVSPTPYYQNTPMLGRLLAEWGEAPAGCLFLLPLWHPVLVAEQIGTLAAIARGPFIMQCGLGWGEARFAAMGADIRTRPSASEAQAVLQHALSRGYRGIPVEALIAGSVDEVAEQFRTFGEIGYTDILVRHFSSDQTKVLGSLERLAAVRAALA